MKVMMISPGGLEHGGGIGRMIGYMLEAWQGRPDAPVVRVVDTRGRAWGLGAVGYFALALVRVCLAACRERPLLHIHLAGRGSTLRKILLTHLAAAVGLRTVLHLHDYDYAAFLASLPAPAVRAVRSMFRRSSAVVVLGQADRALVIARFGLDPSKVCVVPNAAPRTTIAAPADAPPAGGAAAPVRILFLGDPSRRKGVHDLIEALASETLETGAWSAVIAGGGRELDGFRSMVAEKGLSQRVSLPGWLGRQAVEDLLSAADILVLPSYGEGLAMSVLEAMSHGLCIVCTPVGALAEAVTDEVSALVVRPGDPAGLARALSRCIADPSLRRKLGSGARLRFSQVYDAADYPDRIMQVYLAALSASAPTGAATPSPRALPNG